MPSVEPTIVCWCGTRIGLARYEGEDVWIGTCPGCGAGFACTEPAARAEAAPQGS